MNIILLLLNVLLLGALPLASIYVAIILIIQYCKQTDTETAKFILLNFLMKCFTKPKLETIYPVFIGIDNMNRPHADIIEQEFEKLSTIFKCVHFSSYTCNDNRLLYCFNVELPFKDMEEYDLVKYCTSVCNDIVHKFLHKKSPEWGNIYNLVFVRIQENILYLYIAKNQTGTTENSTDAYNQHTVYTVSSSADDTIRESWENK